MIVRTIKNALCIALLLTGCGAAAEPAGLPARLVARFSRPWNTMQGELEQIEKQLAPLPDIPAEPLGGTSGLLGLYSGSKRVADEIECTIDVLWNSAQAVKLVSLVPARIYTSEGIEAEYRIPAFFTIELLDGLGNPVYSVAKEHAANARLIRRGFPFTYLLSSPVDAHGVRIRCRGLQDHFFNEQRSSALAWAELFCFSGTRNVAKDAEVQLRANADIARPMRHWAWNAACLTDGQTPLGLPEKPSRKNRFVGWISSSSGRSAEVTKKITIHLSKPVPVDTLTLYPTRRTGLESVPGFALPQQFQLIAVDPDGKSRILIDKTKEDVPNPGKNPLTFHFPRSTVQDIELVCHKIWKPFPDYSAFLAFSEIQLLDGEINRIHRAKVAVPSNRGLHGESRPASLTDGYGIDGKLIPRNEWLLLLNRRLELETQRKQLQAASDQILNAWTTVLLSSAWTLFGLMLLAIVILPIRYRLRVNRMLAKVRRRIADNLHDEVGANLGSIAINSEMLEQIGHINTEREREMLADIHRTATETATEIRLLTRFLDKDRVNGDLLAQFNHIIRQLLPGTSCIPEFDATKEFNHLAPIEKWELLLFFKEALHNIAKHAQATEVNIRTRSSANALYLEIADNGIGLAPGQAAPAHLTHRAEKLHARLEISHPNNIGTTLLLRIPKRRKK